AGTAADHQPVLGPEERRNGDDAVGRAAVRGQQESGQPLAGRALPEPGGIFGGAVAKRTTTLGTKAVLLGVVGAAVGTGGHRFPRGGSRRFALPMIDQYPDADENAR